MTKRPRWLALLMALAAAPALQADQVKMRITAADQSAARFQSADALAGRNAPIDAALAFLLPKAPAPLDVTTRQDRVIVPAGTVVNVRLSQGIDVDATQTGALFKARVDDPIMIDGRVAIPREAAVVIQVASVEQSGTLKGSDRIALKLNSIAFGVRTYEVVTGYAVAHGKGEGKRTAKKVGAGAGLGAIIGGIAEGGDGAAIGAVVGGIAGTIVAAAGEEHLKLPAETRLAFELTAAVEVQP